MILGVNGWRLQGLRTGVGRYIMNVVKHWTAAAVDGRFQAINFYTPRPLDREEIPLPRNICEKVLDSAWPMLPWENIRLAPVAGDDVLFCPSYSRPVFARGKTVVTTHDACSQLYPELFPVSVRLFYNRLYGWSARHAALVITDSEAAKRDIVRCWGVSDSKIRVVYLAPAEIFQPLPDKPALDAVRQRFLGSTVPFFLFVGKMSGRRHIPRLLESFAAFKLRTALPHKLFMVGLNVHNLGLTELLNSLGITGEVKHSGYVSDDELKLIYNAAEAFISPSVYETVSLPVMEAQATGTPVICIDTAGMREITGGNALLIPKFEVREMAEAIAKLAEDAAWRRELSVKGLSHAKQFSWQRCAAETLAVLAEAATLH